MCGLKYTGELNILCGILGREEELNNDRRRVTQGYNEGWRNTWKYVDWIYIDNLNTKKAPIKEW